MDGVSLVPSLEDPSNSTDRDVFLPSHRRGSYAIINMNWRYIYYTDGTEELYNVKEDPNEWYNLAGDEAYDEVIQELKESAPTEFAEEATDKKTLKLVIEGDSFHWEKREQKDQ
jgi:arylsulfatase A-like enzyme